MGLASWGSSLDESSMGSLSKQAGCFWKAFPGTQVPRYPGTQVSRYVEISYPGTQVFLYLSYVLFSSQHSLGGKLPFGSSRPFYDLPRPLAPTRLDGQGRATQPSTFRPRGTSNTYLHPLFYPACCTLTFQKTILQSNQLFTNPLHSTIHLFKLFGKLAFIVRIALLLLNAQSHLSVNPSLILQHNDSYASI